MNILKKIRNQNEGEEQTIKKISKLAPREVERMDALKNGEVFYLIDFEYREESIWCTMAMGLQVSKKEQKGIWVGKTSSKLILGKRYILVNFQEIHNEGSEILYLSHNSCFADSMMLY